MKETVEIQVSKFDLSTVPDDSVCVFIGKRRSGKSCTIRDLLYHKRYLPMGKVVSGSEVANPFFSSFFPSSYITTEYSDRLLDNVLKRQEKIKQYAEEQRKLNGREIDPRFVLVFDDCLHDESWKRKKQIKNLFMNGRHFNILFLLSMHYVIGIPPGLRTNVDYVFIFRDPSPQNRRKIWDNFGGAIKTFDMFCALMDSLGKFECLVLCTCADKVRFEDQVMYFKCEIRKNFRFGSAKMWEEDKKLKMLRYNNPQENEMPCTSNNNYNVVKKK